MAKVTLTNSGDNPSTVDTVEGINGDISFYSLGGNAFDDTVIVKNNWSPGPFFLPVIRTYSGDDFIDARERTARSSPIVIFAGDGNDTVYGGAGVEHVFDGKNYYDGYSISNVSAFDADPPAVGDFVDLGGGNDIMEVGAGDDVYHGGSGRDWLMFRLYETIEYVYDSDEYVSTGFYEANNEAVFVDLSITTERQHWLGEDFEGFYDYFGSDIISGFENVVGGGGNDVIKGDSNANWLYGGDGNDELNGRDGADKLFGGLGEDIMIGGKGADQFYCTGVSVNVSDTESRDIIRFEAVTDSGLTKRTRDTIYYFDQYDPLDPKAPSDAIDLRELLADGQEFKFLGYASRFTDAGPEVRLQKLGAHTIVHVDLDGTTGTELSFYVYGVNNLTINDFILTDIVI